MSGDRLKPIVGSESRAWRLGSPPSVGWWPASRLRRLRIVRWWNGAAWSMALAPSTNPKFVNELARRLDPDQRNIYWTNRPASWPKESVT